jgi:iron complex transport system permease protein
MSRRAWVVIGLLAALAVCMGALRLLTGDTWGWPVDGEILELRTQRLVIGATVGAALATAGALLQALLRNPLASPYVVGISSGAAVGVMVSAAGWVAFLGLVADELAALTGAVMSMLAVYVLAQRRGRIDPLGLLLVGVIVNAINGAAIMCINYLMPQGLRGQMVLWTLGYLNENLSSRTPVVLLAIVLAGIAAAWWQGRAMDVASFSDAEAHSLGLNLPRIRLILFGIAGLLTSISVVLAGPIGFVGLICPHFVRLLLGPTHRPLIIGSALAGAALVVGADAGVKLLDRGQGLLPIGILTSLVGGPVFLLMLRPHLGRGMDT